MGFNRKRRKKVLFYSEGKVYGNKQTKYILENKCYIQKKVNLFKLPIDDIKAGQ
jgi:hypothetical protein